MPETAKTNPHRDLSRMGVMTNAVWAVLGTLAYGLGRLGILVILTQLFDSPKVGRVFYALAVVTPLSHLINMELRSIFVTDTHHRLLPGHCLAWRLFSNLFFALVLIGLCLWKYPEWELEGCLLILMAGAIRSAESWADVYLGVFQKYEYMRRWTISQTAKIVFVLLWVMALAHRADSIVWMLFGWLIGTLLITWFYDRRQAKKITTIKFNCDLAILRPFIWRAFPLGVFVTVAILNHHVAQYFIKSKLGDAAVAYFGVLMLYVSGLSAVQNGVNQALLARLARYYHGQVHKFWKWLIGLLILTWLALAPIFLIVAWKGREILLLLHRQDYADYAPLFTAVIAGAAIMLTGMILGDAIVACHRFKSRLLAMVLGLIANLAVCFFFLDSYGLKAAVVAYITSAFVVTATCAIVLVSSCRKKTPFSAPQDPEKPHIP